MQRIDGLLLILLLFSINIPLWFFPPSTLTSIHTHSIQTLSGIYLKRENDQIWNQFFNSHESREAHSIIESRLGGFVVTGYKIESTAGLGDEHVWMTKIDSDGNIEWERLYGGNYRGRGQSVIECQNNDLAVAGVIDNGSSYAFVFRTDPDGNLIWERILKFTEQQEAHAIMELPTGNLVICGWAWHYRPTNPLDGLAICLDGNGILQWYREYGGLEDEWFYSMSLVADQGIAFTGLTQSYGNAREGMWVVKTDFQGMVEWNRTFGGAGYDRGNSIVSNALGELTIAGFTQDIETDRYDALVVHTTSNGALLWNQTIGLELDEIAQAITLCSDGGYAFTGEISQSGDSLWTDMIVVRLNDNGVVLWQKIYGDQGNDFGISLIESLDGDLVIAGFTSSYGYQGGTAWLTCIPNAPPPAINPRQVNLPFSFLGIVLALFVLGIAVSLYFRSQRELKQRIKACT